MYFLAFFAARIINQYLYSPIKDMRESMNIENRRPKANNNRKEVADKITNLRAPAV
jgi:hypothetical protein